MLADRRHRKTKQDIDQLVEALKYINEGTLRIEKSRSGEVDAVSAISHSSEKWTAHPRVSS